MDRCRITLDPLDGMRPDKPGDVNNSTDLCQDAESPMDWRELGRRVLSEAQRLARESAGFAAQPHPAGACDATRDGDEAFADLTDAADTTSSVSHLEHTPDEEDAA
jgi:hypothetical protein